VCSFFPRLIIKEENEIFYRAITKDELYNVLSTFKKEKIPDLDGWTTEFFLEFFDVLGEDLV
jgi:hypothetical protein